MQAGRMNAIATGAATTRDGERVAEIAAAETAAAAAAFRGPVTKESAASAANRGQKAAVRKSPPGAGPAANAGAAGAGAALMAKIDGEIPLVQTGRVDTREYRRALSMNSMAYIHSRSRSTASSSVACWCL